MNASANSSYPFDLSCGTLDGINGSVEALHLDQARDPKTTVDLAASSGGRTCTEYYYPVVMKLNGGMQD